MDMDYMKTIRNTNSLYKYYFAINPVKQSQYICILYFPINHVFTELKFIAHKLTSKRLQQFLMYETFLVYLEYRARWDN